MEKMGGGGLLERLVIFFLSVESMEGVGLSMEEGGGFVFPEDGAGGARSVRRRRGCLARLASV